jgi:Rrf2 family transcriptional regulator, iron-sulfur cluster assembly transcription factor
LFKIETRYALHAVVILAQNDGRVRNPFLSEKMDLSLPMVAKIMNKLGQGGLVDSKPGPGGGYKLSRQASGINLFDVISLNEGNDWGGECILGKPECSDSVNCEMHCSWGELRKHILKMLHEHTVQEMADGVVDLSLKVQGK